MSDGGMGSLSIRLAGRDQGSAATGSAVSELVFMDADGVKVIATLFVDEDGLPFELDIWKTDFSPLVRVPESPFAT